MRLHEKAELLLSLRPDVAVVPECACPEVVFRRLPGLPASGVAWTGTIARKGLAVFAFGPFGLDAEPSVDRCRGSVLPVRVSGPWSFRLLAVRDAPRARRGGAGRGVTLATGIGLHERLLKERPAIVAGDFNRTLLRKRRSGEVAPSRLARRIEALGFASAYHLWNGVSLGAERDPTLFLNRRLPGRHHSDFCFLDLGTAGRIRRVEVGPVLPWILASDHAPLLVEIESTALDPEARGRQPLSREEGGPSGHAALDSHPPEGREPG